MTPPAPASASTSALTCRATATALPANRPLGPAERRQLRREARRVLFGNWTGNSTVPSHGLYPHQWSWDSAFIAIGLRHLSPTRAQRELETLMGAQWGDGRIPHIVFNPDVPQDAYFPGPDFWRTSTCGEGAGAPRTLETSGIIQPPVHALAAWHVHQADPRLSRRRGFLSRIHPRLTSWHRYLADRRDLGGGGLAAVVHPWEPGMDNSPCWDGPLARIEPASADSFRRADLTHGAAADRPTDLDYGRYVRLAADYRDHGYRDEDAPHHFAVEDPAFNALLIASEHALASVASELGGDPAPHRKRAAALTSALVERLWSPEAGQFLCRDLRAGHDSLLGAGGEAIAVRSVAGLLPLIAPGLPRHIVASLLRTITGEHFGLGTSVRLVPSYDLLGPAFDPYRYWRGPAWFNVNWLLEQGLRQCGELERAEALRADVLTAASSSRFAEYLDPYTGCGRGTRDFSWTAALALDLLDGHGGEEDAERSAGRPNSRPTPVNQPAPHPGPHHVPARVPSPRPQSQAQSASEEDPDL